MSAAPRSHASLWLVGLASILSVAVVCALHWGRVRPDKSEPPPPAEPEAPTDQGPIRCHLVRAGGWWGQDRPEVRIQLTNTSDRPVSLWYSLAPHYHITFLIRDSEGKEVGKFWWGSLSSLKVMCDPETGRPMKPPPMLTLQPGETHTGEVYLSVLRDHCNGPRVPGRYWLEAVFDYHDLGGVPEPNQRFSARSPGLPLDVGPTPDGERLPRWSLP
jgi:hypothetical protein